MKRCFFEILDDDSDQEEARCDPKEARSVKKEAPLLGSTSQLSKKVCKSDDVLHKVVRQELLLGTELFVYQFAEDFVREALVAPVTKAGHYGKHLPFSVVPSFTTLPGVDFFQALASQADVDVFDSLMEAFPTLNKELTAWIRPAAARTKFYTFLLKFAWSMFVTKDIKFFWNSQVGFGVKAAVNLSRNTVLQSCWGTHIRMTNPEFYLCDSQKSQTQQSYILCNAEGVEYFYAFFGPLAFVNFSCKRCFTVVFSDKCTKRALAYPFVGKLTSESLNTCTTVSQLFVEDELFLCYKPLLSVLQCTHPGHNVLTSFTSSVPQSEINN